MECECTHVLSECHSSGVETMWTQSIVSPTTIKLIDKVPNLFSIVPLKITFACKADSNCFEGNCLFQRQRIFSWFWYFVTLQEFPHLSWSKPCIGIIICNRFLESARFTCTLLVSLFEKWLLERILFPSHRQLVMCCVLCMWVLYVSSLVIEIYGSKARPHSTTNWSLINSWVKQTKFLSLNTVNTVSCCYSNSFNTWDTNMSMSMTWYCYTVQSKLFLMKISCNERG